jgi:hypothetical protein
MAAEGIDMSTDIKPPYGDTEKWPVVGWPELESLTQRGCQCPGGCGHVFSADNPPELAVRCHTGEPLYVAYWDGWLYFSCSKCSKPVCKIAVNQSLL